MNVRRRRGEAGVCGRVTVAAGSAVSWDMKVVVYETVAGRDAVGRVHAAAQRHLEDVADPIRTDRVRVGPEDDAVVDAEALPVDGEVLAGLVRVGRREGPGAAVADVDAGDLLATLCERL